jgi:hypothetical protein
MEVTRELYAPINISINDRNEFNLLVNVLEDSVDAHEIGSVERNTLIDMCSALSELTL